MFQESYKKYLVNLSKFFLFRELREVDLENPLKTVRQLAHCFIMSQGGTCYTRGTIFCFLSTARTYKSVLQALETYDLLKKPLKKKSYHGAAEGHRKTEIIDDVCCSRC